MSQKLPQTLTYVARTTALSLMEATARSARWSRSKSSVQRLTTNTFTSDFLTNNKYWQKNAHRNSIVAISNKPEENTMKPSCTLFESSLQSDELHLTHVKTGWRVMINNFTKAFYVNKNSIGAPLRFVDWDRLVKLPQHVAFKGYNGEYLKAYHHEDLNYLQFGSDDPISTLSGHKVSLMRDDHVRI